MVIVQPHSQRDHLTDDVHFIHGKHQRRAPRSRVGHQRDAIALLHTPAAIIAAAVFEEVNGPVRFRMPARGDYLPFRFVQHDEGSRVQQRVHEEVFSSDESVALVRGGIGGIEEEQRHFAPARDYPGQIGGPDWIETGLESDRA